MSAPAYRHPFVRGEYYGYGKYRCARCGLVQGPGSAAHLPEPSC